MSACHSRRRKSNAAIEAYGKSENKSDKYEEEHMETSKKNEIKEIAYKDGSKNYYPEGTQFYFDTPEKAESALVTNGRGGTKTYANPSKNPEINSLQRDLGFSIDAPVSILGDLSFSLIKRSYGIKDYGSIFPGHGGMLDRFDSIIFTAPVLVAINQFIPFITVG